MGSRRAGLGGPGLELSLRLRLRDSRSAGRTSRCVELRRGRRDKWLQWHLDLHLLRHRVEERR